MPSVAQAAISPLNGRKRRREDGPGSIEMQMKLSSPHLQRHASASEATAFFNNDLVDISSRERRQLVPKSRRHDSKRQRVDPSYIENEPFSPREPLVLGHGNTLERQPQNSTDRIAEERKPKIVLSPCHICRRKPTVKAELDAFADCEGCSKRTCYICIRACPGLASEKDFVMEGDCDSLTFSLHGERDDMDFSPRTGLMPSFNGIATRDDESNTDTARKEEIYRDTDGESVAAVV